MGAQDWKVLPAPMLVLMKCSILVCDVGFVVDAMHLARLQETFGGA